MSAAPPRRASPIRGISAVLPARNEQGNLAHVVETTLEALSDAAPSFEVIIVDDGSTDATRRIADELASTHAAVRVIHHARSQGYGSAWRSGINNATMQYTLFVDADRQFNPIELERLIQWDDRYDLVLGYRLRRNDPFYRRFLGVWFKLIVRLLFGVKTRDVNCGFKLMRTSMLKGFTLESRGALISTEIVYRAKQAGAEIREVGVHHFPRRSGKASATNLRAAVRAVAEIARLGSVSIKNGAWRPRRLLPQKRPPPWIVSIRIHVVLPTLTPSPWRPHCLASETTAQPAVTPTRCRYRCPAPETTSPPTLRTLGDVAPAVAADVRRSCYSASLPEDRCSGRSRRPDGIIERKASRNVLTPITSIPSGIFPRSDR